MALPELYSRLSPREAVVAFAPEASTEWFCDQQFAVLPKVVLVFATLGNPISGTRFRSPSHLSWVPGRTDYHPDDTFPWLPAPVRETWDFQRQCRTKDYHLFVRGPGDGSFLYVGRVHLRQYGVRNGAGSAEFELQERLPEPHWLAFGGYSGWQVEVNHTCHPIASGDAAALEPLLTSLLEGEFGHLSLTRYEEDSLHLHTNAQRGWLMYLSDPGDSGLYVRNPHQNTDPSGWEEFYCGCGTSLEFPFRHTLPREEAVRAVREFFLTGELPAWVSWGDEDDFDDEELPTANEAP